MLVEFTFGVDGMQIEFLKVAVKLFCLPILSMLAKMIALAVQTNFTSLVKQGGEIVILLGIISDGSFHVEQIIQIRIGNVVPVYLFESAVLFHFIKYRLPFFNYLW